MLYENDCNSILTERVKTFLLQNVFTLLHKYLLRLKIHDGTENVLSWYDK